MLDPQSGVELNLDIVQPLTRHGIVLCIVNAPTFLEIVDTIRNAPKTHPFPYRHILPSELVPTLYKMAIKDPIEIIVTLSLCGGTLAMDGATVMREELINIVGKLGDRDSPLPYASLNNKPYTSLGEKKTEQLYADAVVHVVKRLPYGMVADTCSYLCLI
ncbi:hypothetical protein SARC_05872 [Sphaeroforma arctica JP610]|uniref:Uncharacterized protein n=1 Tax=Sphaeroforma arctica JP610 TaxID=667725 RepID=A0A0L0FYW2_9EUKA|nr:hypothetical protein SARC_05872 [Sphaeroforma arctica JP610]KNC81819.1 hypothetical protein SARC_05872 [Sphaeroforma arctica JP610]|eukprot:XP_014155721.1 hypothetical protein SARC_05872 [Sphaeroforma arctica JP610]